MGEGASPAPAAEPLQTQVPLINLGGKDKPVKTQPVKTRRAFNFGGLNDEGRHTWFISPIKGNPESEAAFRKRAGETFKRNEWNTYRITCKGTHIRIEVNGVVTTDVHDDKDARGVIGIQHHGEKGQTYKFRNLRIKELK